MNKVEGKVKSFNKDKGYGFIVDQNNENYFFHYSSLNMEGFKKVDVGAKVHFEKVETEKGLRAVNIDID